LDLGCLRLQVREGASKLDLSHWSIRLANDGVSVLAESLQRMQRMQLSSIILNNNDIGPAGATSLSSALSKNATLTRISLTSNVLGDSGAGAIAKALKSNNTLRSLDLEENGIGQQGATALAEALVTNRGLESLHLSENPFGDPGAVSLGNSLTLNSTLITLWLGGNNIGLAGGRALSESLKKNSTLKTLHLGTPRIGHAVTLSSLQHTSTSDLSLQLQFVPFGSAQTFIFQGQLDDCAPCENQQIQSSRDRQESQAHYRYR